MFHVKQTMRRLRCCVAALRDSTGWRVIGAGAVVLAVVYEVGCGLAVEQIGGGDSTGHRAQNREKRNMEKRNMTGCSEICSSFFPCKSTV